MAGRRAFLGGLVLSTPAGPIVPHAASAFELRDAVVEGPYNESFYDRQKYGHRIGAAMQFVHSKQHDLLPQTPLAARARYDQLSNDQSVAISREQPWPGSTIDHCSNSSIGRCTRWSGRWNGRIGNTSRPATSRPMPEFHGPRRSGGPIVKFATTSHSKRRASRASAHRQTRRYAVGRLVRSLTSRISETTDLRT